jgi:hypothetical protein
MSKKCALIARALVVTATICANTPAESADVWSLWLQPARTESNQLFVWIVLGNVSEDARLFCFVETFYAIDGFESAPAYRAGGTIISPALTNCANKVEWQRVRPSEHVSVLVVVPVERMPRGRASLKVNVTGYSHDQYEVHHSPLILGASMPVVLDSSTRGQDSNTYTPDWVLRVEHFGSSMAATINLTNVGKQEQVVCAPTAELVETLDGGQEANVTPLFTRRGAACPGFRGQIWPFAWLVRPGEAWSKVVELPSAPSPTLKRAVRTCFFDMTSGLWMVGEGRRTCLTTSLE